MDPNTMMNLRRLNIVPYGGYDPRSRDMMYRTNETPAYRAAQEIPGLEPIPNHIPGRTEIEPIPNHVPGTEQIQLMNDGPGMEGGINNLLQFIRMQRLFDPNRTQEVPFESRSPVSFDQQEQVTASPRMDMSPEVEPDPRDIEGRLRALYDPENRANDRMWDMIENMPTRDNYKPSIWRKIGAGIVGGFQGAQAGSQMLNKPYDKAAADWKMKFDPLAKVADDERLSNNSQRQFAQSVLLEEGREGRDIRRNEIREKQLGIQQQRVDVQKFRAENPNLKFDVNDKGQIISLNPANGQAQLVLDSKGMPVKSADLTDEQRLQMQLRNTLTVEDARQGNRSILQDDRQAFERDIFNKAEAGRNARDANNSSGGSDGQSQLEVTRARKNRANEFAIRNPELARKWIKMDGDNVTIKPASGSWGRSPSKAETDERQKVVDAVLGSPNDPKNVKAADKLPANATPPKAPKGWKYQMNKAGTAWEAVKE